jgi:hypothetical protein
MPYRGDDTQHGWERFATQNERQRELRRRPRETQFGGRSRDDRFSEDRHRFTDQDQAHDYGGFIEGGDEPYGYEFGPEADPDYGRRYDVTRRRDYHPRYEYERDAARAGRDDDRRDYVRSAGTGFGGHGMQRAVGASHGPPRRYGAFRGRGPQTYQRSDERIRDDICDRLTDDEFLDATDIEVKVAAGEVILSGTVDGRDAKRWAEDIAGEVSGVKDVRNELRVQRPPSSAWPGSHRSHGDPPDIGTAHGRARPEK